MATYYINGYNTASGGIYPYNTPDNGAPNFTTLFSNVNNIKDDDIIIISDGDYIDQTSGDVDILYKLTIRGNPNTPVKLKNDGFGFNVQMDGVVLNGVYFLKDDYVDNTMISINANDVRVYSCNFDYNASSGKGSVINMNSIKGADIRYCYINVPLGTPLSYGLYANDCCCCNIYDNVIDMDSSNGQAIVFLNNSNYNTIEKNIIGDFDENTSGNIGINVGNRGNYNKITKNVIAIAGQQSSAIVYGTSNIGGKDVEISNNVISVREDDFGCVGIFIPYNPTNTESYYTIINNIISYRGSTHATPLVVTGANDSVAINASILRGFIDFNDIYGFDETNRFVNNGAPDVIKEIGDKNIYTDPRTVYSIEPDKYEPDDIRRYYLTPTSECIGSGYMHHNIGIGVDDTSYSEDTYVNIVDTVTNEFGFVDGSEDTVMTFFNSLFTEGPSVFNSNYRGTITTSAIPYPSELVYRNQWDYNMTMTFPFTKGDHFYNKDFIYVLANKRDLKPFPNILCPANPGYGFSAYPNYENGLWGFPRVNYKNGCFPDPCIIQDSYIEDITIEDRITNVEFWILDKINPDCLDETGDTSTSGTTKTPPVITILGNNPLYVYQNSTFVDPGATAYDAEDGDITWKINELNNVNTSVLGSYTVIYTVTDSDGLQDTKTRTVEVILEPDTTKPIITILGDNPASVVIGNTYVDAGATAWDNRDGDITHRIVTTNNVNVNKIGKYTVVYTVSDNAGNRATATRIVEVSYPILAKTYHSNGVTNIVDSDFSTVITWSKVGYSGALGTNNENTYRIEILPLATSIDRNSFSYFGNSNMETVTIPNHITSIGYWGFANCSKHPNGVEFESGSTLTTIGDGAFTSWSEADMDSNLVIPASVTSIGYNAFASWRSMKNGVEFEAGTTIQTIKFGTFQQWHSANMTQLEIPASVTQLNNSCFEDWKSMTGGIKFNTVAPPFNGANSCFAGWDASTANGGIEVTVPGGSDLTVWKHALNVNGIFKSINGVLWNDIPW